MKKFQTAQAGEKCPATGKKISAFNPRPPWRAVVLLLGLFFASNLFCRAQNAPTEYQIKAAFVYNFVKFVEWPAQAFAATNSPIVIGVLGQNVFGDNLEQAIQNKVINGHPLQFKTFQTADEATNCQVLFISASEKNHFPEILGVVRDKSILTVSESDGFIQAGGIINFVIVDNHVRHVRFQINNGQAQKTGLKISSNLLSLAVPVH